MGEELQGLAVRENDSDSEHEEEEVAPKDSPVETLAPRTVTSPIPLFGVPPTSVHANIASVRDSVSSTMPKQTALPLVNAEAGKANAATKGKFILDPMIGSTPPYVDFTASWSGDDLSLVDRPVDVAMNSAGGSAPLTAASGQVKTEAPPRYSGKG